MHNDNYKSRTEALRETYLSDSNSSSSTYDDILRGIGMALNVYSTVANKPQQAPPTQTPTNSRNQALTPTQQYNLTPEQLLAYQQLQAQQLQAQQQSQKAKEKNVIVPVLGSLTVGTASGGITYALTGKMAMGARVGVSVGVGLLAGVGSYFAFDAIAN